MVQGAPARPLKPQNVKQTHKQLKHKHTHTHKSARWGGAIPRPSHQDRPLGVSQEASSADGDRSPSSRALPQHRGFGYSAQRSAETVRAAPWRWIRGLGSPPCSHDRNSGNTQTRGPMWAVAVAVLTQWMKGALGPSVKQLQLSSATFPFLWHHKVPKRNNELGCANVTTIECDNRIRSVAFGSHYH